MAIIEQVDWDVSSEFKELAGTVILTHLVREEGLPTGALLVDHKTKQMYIYEYQEGELTVALTPIEDEAVRVQLEEVVQRAMEHGREGE